MSRRRPQHPSPALPGVNLLSPAAFEAIAVLRLRRRFLVAGIALVALLVGLTVSQQMRVRAAEHDVDAQRTAGRKLSDSVAELKPVQTYVTGVRSQVTTAQETMTKEIYFSDVFAGVAFALPPEAQLGTLSVTLADPAAAEAEGEGAIVSACPGPDPFNTLKVVGCAAIAGTAESRADVGELVVALSKNGLFVEPFITTTTLEDSTNVSFSGSVGLSVDVFSGRYADLAAELFPQEAGQ
jgi:hypothetical protein